tara:strand:+ start:914 stop:1159 length:246 start_codon:yes stop_codon:yes gene_type:complete
VIIKEEITAFLIESRLNNEEQESYSYAESQAREKGDDKFEFPIASGVFHEIDILDEYDIAPTFKVMSLSGKLRSCDENGCS